jgi:hypothetical protein
MVPGLPIAPIGSPIHWFAAISPVRFDGLYYRCEDGNNYTSFLRFYDDTTVITTSVLLKKGQDMGELARQTATWFTKQWCTETRYGGLGKFFVDGDRIGFSATSDQATVDFQGTLTHDAIILHSRSRSTVTRAPASMGLRKSEPCREPLTRARCGGSPDR